MKMTLKTTFILTATAALLALPALSKADTMYSIGLFNISGYTGPYASVNVSLTSSTTATITFTSLTNSGLIYLLGAQGCVAVNVNASSWTLGTVTGVNSGTGFSPGPFSNGGAGNEDGWGSFNQTINSMGAFTQSSDMITFSLTNTGGTWANSDSVLGANGSGYSVAAHILVTTDPANASNGALVTGYATNGGSVPDGGTTVMLLGSALGGLGLLRRFFRR